MGKNKGCILSLLRVLSSGVIFSFHLYVFCQNWVSQSPLAIRQSDKIQFLAGQQGLKQGKRTSWAAISAWCSRSLTIQKRGNRGPLSVFLGCGYLLVIYCQCLRLTSLLLSDLKQQAFYCDQYLMGQEFGWDPMEMPPLCTTMTMASCRVAWSRIYAWDHLTETKCLRPHFWYQLGSSVLFYIVTNIPLLATYSLSCLTGVAGEAGAGWEWVFLHGIFPHGC